MRVKFEYGKGTEKLIVIMHGSQRIIDDFQTKAQWLLFKQGWTLKKTTVLGKKKKELHLWKDEKGIFI